MNSYTRLHDAAARFLNTVPQSGVELKGSPRADLIAALQVTLSPVGPVDNKHSIDFTYTLEDQGFVVDLSISATVVSYVRATRDEPADGGYLEDETFRVTGLGIKIKEDVFNLAPGQQMKIAVAKLFEEEYHKDEELQGKIHRLFIRD
jgi:hypothetical protein